MTKITSSRSRTKGRREVHGTRSPDTPLSSSSSPSPFTANTVSAGAPAVDDETDGCLEAGVQKLGGGGLRDVGVDAEETAATAPRTSSPNGSRDSAAAAAAWNAHTDGRDPVKDAGGGGQGLEAATQPKSGAEDGGPRSQCRDRATGASGRRARGTEGTAARGAVARGVVAERGDLSATTSTDVRSP